MRLMLDLHNASFFPFHPCIVGTAQVRQLHALDGRKGLWLRGG